MTELKSGIRRREKIVISYGTVGQENSSQVWELGKNIDVNSWESLGPYVFFACNSLASLA